MLRRTGAGLTACDALRSPIVIVLNCRGSVRGIITIASYAARGFRYPTRGVAPPARCKRIAKIALSAPVGLGRVVCVSALSARAYREAGGRGLGGDYGYFVYEADSARPVSGIEIIAKAASLEAALKLYDLIVEDKSRFSI
jgi:hypothetical protein